MFSAATTKNLSLSILFLSLASCSVFQGQESSGQYVDDATITTKVKEALVADPQVKASQVHVETMHGTVQLSGFVDSPASELRAVQLAKQVKGVGGVKDSIVVHNNPNN